MVEQNSVLINFSDSHIERMEALKARTGATRTKDIRELIPREQMLIALEEKQLRMGQDHLSKPGGIYDIVALMLAEEMTNDPEHPIGMQVLYRQQDHEMAHGLSILYLQWAKAKRGADGYRFEQVEFNRKGMEIKFWVVVNEEDGPNNLPFLKDAILELAARIIPQV